MTFKTHMNFMACHDLLIMSHNKAAVTDFTRADKPVVVVRISDVGKEFKELCLVNVLSEHRFFFDDETSGTNVMSRHHATEIIDVLHQACAIDCILAVHCWAGICRSASVGLAWSAINNDRELWKHIIESKWHCPNSLVVEFLLDELRSRDMLPEWAVIDDVFKSIQTVHSDERWLEDRQERDRWLLTGIRRKI